MTAAWDDFDRYKIEGAAPLPPPRGLRALLSRATGIVRTWRRRIEERDALRQFTEIDRRDLGLSDYDIRYEARKPFWRK